MRYAQVFEGLNGRKPTTQETLYFERLVTTLETTPTDALLSVFVACEHYKALFETIPNKINGVVTDTLKTVNDAAKEQAKLAVAETQKELAKSVADATVKVAKSVAHGQTAAMIAGCVVTCTVAGLMTMFISMGIGEKRGFVRGYESAKEEKAALAWSNTKNGKLAYQLDQLSASTIPDIAYCTKKGWEEKKKNGNVMCFPHGATDEGNAVYGWQIR